MILQMICTGDDTIFCEDSYDDDSEVLLGLHRAFCTNARDHEDVKKKMIFCKQSDVGDGRHNVGLQRAWWTNACDRQTPVTDERLKDGRKKMIIFKAIMFW